MISSERAKFNFMGMADRLRAHRSGLVDVLIALVLTASGLTDVLRSDTYRPVGPWIAAIALTSGALLFRRRAPVIVLAVVLLVQAIQHTASPLDDPAFQFFGIVVACFSLGARVRLAPSAGAVAGAVVFFGVFNLSRGTGWEDAIFGGVIFWAAWTVGLAIQLSQQRKKEAETRAVQLESEGEERVQAAVVDERARIARELHDSVAHGVSVMVLQVGAVRRNLREDQHSEREMLTKVEQAGREAVTELQVMLGLLREEDPDAATAARPGLARLDELVEQVRAAGLPVEVRVDGDVHPLPTRVDMSAYRILQEALTNVLKHAGDARALVHVHYNKTEIELEVIDNGRAQIDGEDAQVGHGLIGMQERATLFGGELETGPTPTGGFAVRARLPLQ